MLLNDIAKAHSCHEKVNRGIGHPSFWVIKVPGVFITSCIRIHVKKNGS